MTGLKKSLAAAGLLGAACFAVPAAAHAQSGYYGDGYYNHAGPNVRCQQQREDRQITGAVVGGLLGAVAGGLIADNNFDDDDDHWHHRRYRGRHWRAFDDFDHYGYGRRYRGHRYYRHRGYDDDDGEVLAGVLIGGALGAVAGGALAESNVNCQEEWRYPDVPRPTRSAYGPAWSGPPIYTGHQLAGAPDTQDDRFKDCELVWQETRLPDGRLIREQVEACRDGEIVYEPRTRYGDWGLED